VAGATETYAYDGDGVRFSRTVGGGPAIRYVSDVNVSLPVTLDDGTRKYVWGLGLAYAVNGSAIEIYHTDRLDSVRAITDATGAVTATYRTDEYGVPTAATGTSTQPFGFTGEPYDGTGLSYLRARYYDPSLGQFMSRDSWAGWGSVPSTLNRFVYVENNPIRYVDPSGRCLFICAAIGAVVGGFAGTAAYFATTPSEDWSVGDLAGSAALGAGTGAIIGFTGGVATGAVLAGTLTVTEGAVFVGTAGYATGLLTSGVQRAMGRPVTAGSVFWNVVGGVAGAVVGGPATASTLSPFAQRATSGVISIGRGIAAKSQIKNDN
jgi:RHS repeat-associated protein